MMLSAEGKRELIKQYGKEFKLDVLIETGTLAGDTVEATRNHFREVHSIELSPDLYKRACNRLKGAANVFLYLGNSANVLPKVIRNVCKPCLFWLDAHYSGGETANSPDPLEDELDTIFELSPASVVLIDDARAQDVNRIRWIAEEGGFSFSVAHDVMRLVPLGLPFRSLTEAAHG